MSDLDLWIPLSVRAQVERAISTATPRTIWRNHCHVGARRSCLRSAHAFHLVTLGRAGMRHHEASKIRITRILLRPR